MRRIHFFEFYDQPWFPKRIRRQGMELLSNIFRILKIYDSAGEIISGLVQRTDSPNLVVLAAGSGGGIMHVLTALPNDSKITLTDIFPDLEFSSGDVRVVYDKRSVDARKIPRDLVGTRVIFTAFHHFAPADAHSILKDAVEGGESIAIFEVTQRSLRGLLTASGVMVVTLLLTPFVRPRRWSRLFWTYVIPLIPLTVTWDGCVSALRTYSRKDFAELTAGLDSYEWKYQESKGPYFTRVTAVTGTRRHR